MSETPRAPTPDNELAEAAEAQLSPLAGVIEATFAEMSQSITEELDRASLSGRQSVRELVDGMLDDLTRLAARELIRDPLTRALGGGGDEGGSSLFRSLIRRSVRNG